MAEVKDILFDMENAIIRLEVSVEATEALLGSLGSGSLYRAAPEIYAALYCACEVLRPNIKELREQWNAAFEAAKTDGL